MTTDLIRAYYGRKAAQASDDDTALSLYGPGEYIPALMAIKAEQRSSMLISNRKWCKLTQCGPIWPKQDSHACAETKTSQRAPRRHPMPQGPASSGIT